MSLTRQLYGVALPVFRTENLDTRHATVAYMTERADYLLKRQYAEAGQEPVAILQLRARPLFGVVDVKDEEPFRVERFD